MEGHPQRRRGLAGWARLVLAGIAAGLRALQGELLQLRALALTTITLFSLVPGLLVAFGVARLVADMGKVRGRIHEFLLENLAVGARSTVQEYLDRLLETPAAGAGAVGFLLLALSAVMLFHHVERALNDVWAVRRRRGRLQRAMVYWTGLSLGPLLLGGSLALAYRARDALGAESVLVRSGSVVLTCLFFMVAYLTVPATRVRLVPAAVGGVVAGLAWEAAKWGYGYAVGHLFRFQAIYGSIAAILVFLFWIYLSWMLLLFGARLAFVLQHARALVLSPEAVESPAARELSAARVMLEVARAHDLGRAPPDPDDLADELAITVRSAEEAAALLRASGLVVEVAGGKLAPARPLERISLADVRRLTAGERGAARGDETAMLAEVLSGADALAGARLADATFAELCRRLRAGRVPPSGP
ncbi:MAG TPA: YihY/virulence factor BrkB family protein [Anaeromyxobacteraceae bacterium]|nr:YihY/virulence factor BrkB family protein [Anaeromyxobacteraceae bacterium]